MDKQKDNLFIETNITAKFKLLGTGTLEQNETIKRMNNQLEEVTELLQVPFKNLIIGITDYILTKEKEYNERFKHSNISSNNGKNS